MPEGNSSGPEAQRTSVNYQVIYCHPCIVLFKRGDQTVAGLMATWQPVMLNGMPAVIPVCLDHVVHEPESLLKIA